jgi:primosomal protein N' (replication factor Y)
VGAHFTSHRVQGGCQALNQQELISTPSLGRRIVRVVPNVSGVNKTFDYLVPEPLKNVKVGSIVRVELHGRRVDAWVISEVEYPSSEINFKEVISFLSEGPSKEVVQLSQWAAERFCGPLRAVLSSASPSLRIKQLGTGHSGATRKSSQRGVVAEAEELFDNQRGGVLVWPAPRPLRPVLESGISRGRTLVVTPSVGFARTIAQALRREGLSVALMPDDWQRAAEGVDVVVGARSAVWASIPELKSVIVLDEHDERLQDERSPTWHSRDVAIERARALGIPCLLVSPLPTVSATHWAGSQAVRFVEPASGDWPSIEVVDPYSDLGDEEKPQFGLLSSRLIEVLRDKSKTVVCILNTKGRSRLLSCKACKAIIRCENCDAAVIQNEEGILECNRCGAHRPATCQSCSSNALALLRKGVAKMRDEIEKAALRQVVELSAETTVAANAASLVYIGTEAALHRVSSADVVVFLDFDNELFAPTYRAGEQAWTLLIHATRLLKGSSKALIVLQSQDASNTQYTDFVSPDPQLLIEREQKKRKVMQLPPYAAMARVVFADRTFNPADWAHCKLAFSSSVKTAEFLVRAENDEALSQGIAQLRDELSTRFRCYVDPMRYA